jgi:anti-anti-sigma factor
MKIDTKMFSDVVVLNLIGELDSRGNQQLDKSLTELVRTKIFKVILDLTSIRFMGHQSISIIISHLKEFKANSGNIVFLNPQRMVLQHFKSNRIPEIIEIYSTRSEALKALGDTSGRQETGSTIPDSPAKKPAALSEQSNEEITQLRSRFETGEFLYANSCMLATLIKTLETKGILTSEEARELMDYERLSVKGVAE